jgi:hypothetical protein
MLIHQPHSIISFYNNSNYVNKKKFLLLHMFFATTSGSDKTSKVSGSGGHFEVDVLEVFHCPIDHRWLND